MTKKVEKIFKITKKPRVTVKNFQRKRCNAPYISNTDLMKNAKLYNPDDDFLRSWFTELENSMEEQTHRSLVERVLALELELMRVQAELKSINGTK